MSLTVNEVFSSIQGEGAHSGRLTTFVRLSGCNLRCPWCDTSYAQIPSPEQSLSVKGLKEKVLEVSGHRQTLTLTGGEPLLQKGEALKEFLTWGVKTFKMVTIETNGTIDWDIFHGGNAARNGFLTVWLTVSPKPPDYEVNLRLSRIHEVKLVVTDDLPDAVLDYCEKYVGRAMFLLQPCGTSPEAVEKALEMQKRHPRWLFRMQMHKYLGLR